MNREPPKGAIAQKEDFETQRDSEGQVLPVWEPVPGTSVICDECGGDGCEVCDGNGETPQFVQVVPMSQGDAQKYLPQSGEPGDIPDRMLCQLINRFYVQPSWDLDAANAEEEIENFTAFSMTPLVMALYNASGFGMASGMMVENSDFMEAVEGNSRSGN